MKKKEKLAFVTFKLANGGAERVISNLSLNLNSKFNKQIILYDGSEVNYSYEGNIINLNVLSSKSFISKIITLLRSIDKLKKIKKDYKFRTTISFLEGPNIANILSKQDDKIIISVRNFKSKRLGGLIGRIRKLIVMLLYNKADVIVAISNMVKEDLVKNFNVKQEKIKVIYNPCDIKKIQRLMNVELEEEYKEIFSKPVIINVARLIKEKGQYYLIRAFKKIKMENQNVKLVVLGEGELINDLKKLTQELGLEKDVYFLGFQKNPFKFIRNSKVFAFSSLTEGFGNVLTEAMACGIPVISTDCKAGPREILAPNSNFEKKINDIEYADYGVLVPDFDSKYCSGNNPLTKEENLLAKGINKLLEDEKLRKYYSKMGLERVEDFSIKKITDEWMKVIE